MANECQHQNPNTQSYEREAALVEQWNAEHPIIGTPVRYWAGLREGEGKVSRTRSVAHLLSGHTAVVWVVGEAGCISLSHVEARPMPEIVLPKFALTVRQPWASLIVWGVKDVENRTWPTKFTGRIAIHSSAVLSQEEMDAACNLMRGFIPKFSRRIFERETFPLGAIIGTVEITGCGQRDDFTGCYEGNRSNPWFVGPYGFALDNAVKLAEPIPCKGALGFWRIPEGLWRLG